MIQVAKTEEGMTISQSQLDQDKYLLHEAADAEKQDTA